MGALAYLPPCFAGPDAGLVVWQRTLLSDTPGVVAMGLLHTRLMYSLHAESQAMIVANMISDHCKDDIMVLTSHFCLVDWSLS